MPIRSKEKLKRLVAKKAPIPKTRPKVYEVTESRKAILSKIQTKLDSNKANKQSIWNGPYDDGITFSLLNDFLECRERFRLRVVEGLTEDEGFNPAIEYGQFWHSAEEALSGRRDWRKAMQEHWYRLRAEYPGNKEVDKWYQIACVQFPHYIDRWKNDPLEKSREPLVEETAFRVPYLLPSGAKVILRGKFDCVLTLLNKKKRALYLQENKTKGKIDEDGISATLPFNLQTGIYAVALQSLPQGIGYVEKKAWGDTFYETIRKYPLGGVLYNVIRRPLSDHHAIRQKKAETEKEFIKRVGVGIAAEPERYFLRWQIDLTQDAMDKFCTYVLTPILEQLVLWWDSIVNDPFNPWYNSNPLAKAFGKRPNPHHWQSPWGTYNSLAGGFRGSHFHYLTRQSTAGLKRITNLFPELTELDHAPQSTTKVSKNHANGKAPF